MKVRLCAMSTGKLGNRLSAVVSLLFVLGSVCLPAVAQQKTPSLPDAAKQKAVTPETADEELVPGKVMIEGRHILTVYQPVGTYTPQERAERIAERITAAARDRKVLPESLTVQSRGAWTEIVADGKVLMAVTDADAELSLKPREQLAAEDAGAIRQAILNFRREHSWTSILRGTLYTVFLTAILVLVVWIVSRLGRSVRSRLEKWIDSRAHAEKKTAWYVSVTYLMSVGLALGTVIRWLLAIAIVQAYITLVFSFFSVTRSISNAVTGWMVSVLGSFVTSLLDYLPNLFVIAIIGAIAAQILRLITMIFHEIGQGNLSVKGFYPDWAEPTAKLLRILVLVLVIVIVFPYLPGSKSPAFQGISIFVGLLLSLGSSSAVANAIAGIILTYMRSFLIGDWVKIGDTIGEVVERNILVTRILTPKQEVITIPNATVMNGSVMNYTREATNAGVIFHTTVTIGYDAPWKTVHELLINAAVATEHVLRSPEPFVLQTALNDFYVAYELNAYTDVPRRMQFIYSDLHQNVQDKFNDAGVEICSPHFASLRDGNTIAIPEQYIKDSYKAPAFRVSDAERRAAQAAGRD
jgi:small-conductance mechanosensitive channel